jgi:hypothetical protein
MFEFIVNNIEFFLTLLCSVVVCIVLARRGQLKKIREIVLSLCVNAEITYGGGTGEIKKSSVVEAIYDLLPSWAKLFISERTISNIIEEGKEYMDELAEGNESVMLMLYGALDDAEDEDGDDAVEIESDTELYPG